MKACCSITASDAPACPERVPAPIDRAASFTPASQSPGTYTGPAVPLTDLRPGQTGVVHAVDLAADDASLLRAMGLRTQMRVRLCRLGEPCIVELLGGSSLDPSAANDCPRQAQCSCRIGLSRPLAASVRVCVG